tara:strand:+ start:5387 stop:5767 length:381 start_codon:yes stop_codon:yes gene_type:complete
MLLAPITPITPITPIGGFLRKSSLVLKKIMGSASLISKIKRLFDLFLATNAAVVLLMPIYIVAILVRLTSKGSALYWSDRVGINNVIFKMPKFRSMKVDTPAVATHLLKDPKSVLTPIGVDAEFGT